MLHLLMNCVLANKYMSHEALLQNTSCNRDCVGYCLSYFPHNSILNKCGCMENSGEKFLLPKNT